VGLSRATFSEAADQAGLSRHYGGIHFEAGDLSGWPAFAGSPAAGPQARRLDGRPAAAETEAPSRTEGTTMGQGPTRARIEGAAP
jgi:hypothetical protein